MQKQEKTIIVLAGPTAVGKTAASIKLAKYYDAEIFSADSRQVYKEMRIGTARPSKDQLNKIKHHFIASHSIQDPLSAGKYSRLIRLAWQNYFKNHNIAILCGGTGFYIKAALEGLDDFPKVPNTISIKWRNFIKDKGIAFVQQYVREKDPSYYHEMDTENQRRLLRAAEIMDHTGKPFSSFLKQENQAIPYHVISIQLDLDRPVLYNRINERVQQMINNGLLEEVKLLYRYKHLQTLDTVGYRELFAYLDGKYDIDRAIELIQRNTRRYAKRQMTWFRNQGNYKTFSPQEINNIISYIDKSLALLRS